LKRLVRIDGEAVEPLATDGVEIIETEPGVYSVIAGASVWEARLAGNEITIGGQRFTFEFDDPRQWKRSRSTAGSAGRASLAAAMPGKIVRVLVAVGEQVVAGQGIMVVEAMKMQNELKAPRDGRVTAIEVRENDSVNAGAVLATIE
jgi:biotin carboxyl carrier protein